MFREKGTVWVSSLATYQLPNLIHGVGIMIHASQGCSEAPSVKTYKGLQAKKQAIGGSYYENRSFHLLLPQPIPSALLLF